MLQFEIQALITQTSWFNAMLNGKGCREYFLYTF
jgi:hypothetical protein